MKSVSGGNFSPIPKAMLDMMANLRIKKAQANQNTKEKTPTQSTNEQGRQNQYKSQPNPLKRKTLLESGTMQEYYNSPTPIQMASLEDKASQSL